MSVQTQIDRINSEVTDQASLIDQIKTVLAGKVEGSGGSSGGMIRRTCTVNLNFNGISYTWGRRTYYTSLNSTGYVCYERANNGSGSSETLECACDSLLIILFDLASINDDQITCSGAEVLCINESTVLLGVTASAGGTAEINITNN